MFTYTYSKTHNSALAEDVIHSVFAKLLQRSELPKDLKPFVFKCLKNRVVDEFRTQHREVSPEQLKHVDRHRDELLDLDRCMKQVSEDEREIIILKSRVGLTFREISDITGDSINTVASRYRRGLSKLKDLLNE